MFLNSVLVFLIAGCLISKLITSIKCLDWLQGWFELILELLNLWHIEKMLLVIGLMWDGSMV
jgi:hypothetical protein